MKHAISLEVKKQAAQRESSQERKYQSPLNQCREASTYNFEGHVLQSSAAEEMEKIVTREGLNVHRVSGMFIYANPRFHRKKKYGRGEL